MLVGTPRGRALLALSASLFAIVTASSAVAQDTAPTPGSVPPTTQPATADDTTGEIVVTGSRIRNPNGASAVPINSISAAELLQTGTTNIGEVLNKLPGTANTFSQANSTRFLGTAGLNLIDLYGLGTQRTLVLVNGRRHVASDVLNNAVSTDINTIPSDLIERVDIVTGGSSAIYGSDAIAGVVNFVLKDHFEGLQVRGQGNITPHGDAGSYYGSLLAGKNFADGRGNIAIDLEYARQNSLYASDRSNYASSNGFLLVNSAGGANTSGPANNQFFNDRRTGTISDGGLVAFGSTTGACGRDSQGRAFTCNYLFQPDGSLVQQTGTRVGLAPTAGSPSGSSFIGGNGNTGRENTLVQLYPELDRYSANLIGHFEVSKAFIPFVEASFVRTNSVGQGSSGPAFITGSTIGSAFGYSAPLSTYERPNLDNPYLSTQARAQIISALVAGGANPANITGATRFTLRRNLTDLGTRTESATRDTYRIVGGVRGDLSSHLNYEVSANYGEFIENTRLEGVMNTQRFLLAMDAQRNASGQIVCGSQISAARAGTDLNGDAANLARDIAACVPINPFGNGNISQAAKSYLLNSISASGKLTQLDIVGTIAGDTGAFFNLPGGPIRGSVGGEYRRETARYAQDAGVANGYYFYNAIPAFTPTSFEVKEAFAEVQLPLLRDLPFAKELTVGSAARVSNYKGSAGTTWTYNATGTYKPIDQITFRGSYNIAVRAPNLAELYTPQGQNFAPGFIDPCAADHIAEGSANRAANCAAAGRPAGYNYAYNQSLVYRSGGNPDLKAEESRSITAGVVLQPVRDLVLSVDYYDIKVDNVIQSVDGQTIVDQCYDLSNPNNQFCGQFKRAGATGGSGGEEPFRIIEGSLLASSLNYAKLQARGINTDVTYRHKFGDFGATVHVVWNHSILNDQFTDPTDPTYVTRFNTTVGIPKDRVNASFGFTYNKLFLNYQVRYISPQLIGDYETVNSVQGRAPTNPNQYPNNYYPAVDYHDFRLGVNVTPKSTFYVGIDNAFDRQPPYGSTGIGGGTAIFDNIGRRLYAGVTANF
ncbi:TonB-dependent receptor domain-containing protein [Sphingomonas sp. PWP1-2]|uniref:TonB-dependent receptor domain-containing protein n=1 Tax=Sphingomonas sp. PWP1-2 TaxID=2804558 RepID=UPI003CFA2934